MATTKNQIRQEWDVLVSNSGASDEAWLKAIRLFPFFYDRRVDAERGFYFLRELVRRKESVSIWLRLESNFPWVLTRVMAMLLGSVGSLGPFSEYVNGLQGADVLVSLTG